MLLSLRRALGWLGTFALSAGLVVGAMAAPAQASVTSQPTVEAQLLSLTNASRASAGLPALRSSSTLTSIARSWSAHMATTNVLAHNGSLFSQVSGWSAMGENVAKAYSASQAESLFMGSSGHRANILNTKYTLVGIGVSRDATGALWFTVDFERPSGSTAAPATKPTPKPVVRGTSRATSRSAVANRPSRSTVRRAVPATSKAAARQALPDSAKASTQQLDRIDQAQPGDSVYFADAPITAKSSSPKATTLDPVIPAAGLLGCLAVLGFVALRRRRAN